MEIKTLTIDELQARKSEIAAEIDVEGADLDALESEVRAINTELEARKAAEAAKAEIRDAIASGAGEVIKEQRKEEKKMDILEIRSSNEYAKAYAAYLRSGLKDDTECRSLLSTNVTGGYVPVPTFLETEIKTAWEEHQLMSLVKKTTFKGNVKVGFELSATGASVHVEGAAAPNEETVTIGVVELKAETIKKWITVSDEALEGTTVDTMGYLYKEIAHKIVEKAEEILVGKITASPASATSTACGVPKMVEATPAADTVVKALAQLAGSAQNLHIVMNRATYPVFRALELGAHYGIDVFEGMRDRIVFSDKVAAYSAVTAGNPYMIIGDFGNGFQVNFPNGEEISLLVDNLSLAEKDLVKLVGREYAGMNVVADRHFVNVLKAAQG